MDSKTCTKCGETKPRDEFHRDKSKRDGRRSRCKKCVRAQKAEYYSRNRDAILAQQSEYYARPEVGAHRAEHYAEYYQSNQHIYWEWRYRKRARAYGFDPRVVSFTREELIEAHGDSCVHCGGPFEHLDHYVTPVFRGGAHTIENCRPSCAPCNTARNQFHKSNIGKTA